MHTHIRNDRARRETTRATRNRSRFSESMFVQRIIIALLPSPKHDFILIHHNLLVASHIHLIVNSGFSTHGLELCLGHLENILAEMFDAFHRSALDFVVQGARRREHLARGKHELVWALEE